LFQVNSVRQFLSFTAAGARVPRVPLRKVSLTITAFISIISCTPNLICEDTRGMRAPAKIKKTLIEVWLSPLSVFSAHSPTSLWSVFSPHHSPMAEWLRYSWALFLSELVHRPYFTILWFFLQVYFKRAATHNCAVQEIAAFSAAMRSGISIKA